MKIFSKNTVIFANLALLTTSIFTLSSCRLIPTDGLEYTLADDGISYIVSGIGTATDSDIVIASKYKWFPVTAVGYAAFSSSNITSVTIPSSVITIESLGFENCKNLKSVTFSDGLKTIGMASFSNCASLESVDIPDSVTLIDDYAFDDCKALSSVTLSKNITTISNGSFKNTNIKSIEIPEGVTTIEEEAFFSCGYLSNIVMPNSVISIGAHVFQGCYYISSIHLSKNLTSIGNNAFSRCSNLASITIPASVTLIKSSAFYASGLDYAIFENTYGWKAGSSEIDSSKLADPMSAASSLKFAYFDWVCFNNDQATPL